MRNLLFTSAFFLGLLLLGFAVPASAVPDQTITGSITPQSQVISVVVDDTTLSYGTVVLGTSDVAPSPDDIITATNNGNIQERFNIRGTDATGFGQETWTLTTAAPGANTYNHKFQAVGSSNAVVTSFGSTLIPRDPTTTQFATNVAPSNTGSVALKFRISPPTSTGTLGTRNFSAIIQAAAQ